MSATKKVVVGVGEALWDCFPDSSRPGGAPANVAYQATQLGLSGVVVSRVGDDPPGRKLREYLVKKGLDTSCLQTDPLRPTGKVTVDTSNPDRPVFLIHEETAWDYMEFDGRLGKVLDKASAICFGTLAQRSETSRETIHRCLSAAGDAVVVYDVNLRQRYFRREWIERSLHAASVVKLNMEEAVAIAELLRAGSPKPLLFAAFLRREYKVDLVCITRSEDGCLVVGADDVVDLPGRKIQVVDAVGAGDAVTAALINGILRGWPLRTTAEFANEVGTLMVTRLGAMPDTRHELDELVARFEPSLC